MCCLSQSPASALHALTTGNLTQRRQTMSCQVTTIAAARWVWGVYWLAQESTAFYGTCNCMQCWGCSTAGTIMLLTVFQTRVPAKTWLAALEQHVEPARLALCDGVAGAWKHAATPTCCGYHPSCPRLILFAVYCLPLIPCVCLCSPTHVTTSPPCLSQVCNSSARPSGSLTLPRQATAGPTRSAAAAR